MTAAYELGTAPPARRALAEKLPVDVAAAAAEFITGPLLAHPRRVGKPLGQELAGIYSARLARDWRVLYEIDDARQVTVLAISHRRETARDRELIGNRGAVPRPRSGPPHRGARRTTVR